jgi:hypothetical protein
MVAYLVGMLVGSWVAKMASPKVDDWVVRLAVLLVNPKVDGTAESWAVLMVSP